jgi:hypothetical protein
VRKQGSASFLKKRSKKLLVLDRAGCTARGPVRKSFFASFFSKKEALACSPSLPGKLSSARAN